jgi:hypothetical protein
MFRVIGERASRATMFLTICQVDDGPVLSGLAVFTKSGVLEATGHANRGWST